MMFLQINHFQIIAIAITLCTISHGWVMHPTVSKLLPSIQSTQSTEVCIRQSMVLHSTTKKTAGFLHGQSSCFMPLAQLDQDYYAPRIIQIAGAYPGLTESDVLAVTSDEAPEPGQWAYHFNDPDGPPEGTVAIEGSTVVYMADDPIAIIAEHPSIGIELPPAITEPVDLVVLVDRAKPTFAERKFLCVALEDGTINIGAFHTKADLPAKSKILGQVILVQIPWLPAMKATKTGFMEEDEYF